MFRVMGKAPLAATAAIHPAYAARRRPGVHTPLFAFANIHPNCKYKHTQ